MKTAAPKKILERHRVFNRNSADCFTAFESHRQQVKALLAQAESGGRLLVLGAGNGNDLDLEDLGARFSEIHLCDLDEEAMERLTARLPEASRARFFQHAPVDATGLLTRLSPAAFGGPAARPPPDGKTQTQIEAEIDHLVAAGQAEVQTRLPGPFEVVLSAALLSQIMHSARLCLGEAHPQLPALAQALVVAHLQTLAALTAPGGRAILVTDVVSSETYPLEELWDAQPPMALLERLEKEENVFSGVGPAFLRRMLGREAGVQASLRAAPRFVEPWLWRLGEDLTLLAYAIVLERGP